MAYEIERLAIYEHLVKLMVALQDDPSLKSSEREELNEDCEILANMLMDSLDLTVTGADGDSISITVTPRENVEEWLDSYDSEPLVKDINS